jgi:tetratricopeptide (TPR) repeat protein
MVAFSPDARTMLTGSVDKTARLWDISEIPDDPGRIARWGEVITGMETDKEGEVRSLSTADWQERHEQLDRQGGPPPTRERWRLDPIIFGPDPTARAKAWMERKRWAEAEAAFTEAASARPLDTAIVLEQVQFYRNRSQPEKEDALLTCAYTRGLHDPTLLDAILERESLFRRVVAQSPGSAGPLWARHGDVCARENRWAEAGADYTRAIDIDGNDPGKAAALRAKRGEARAHEGRWSEAAADYQEAVRLKPEDPDDWAPLVLSLLAAGDDAGLKVVSFDILKRFGNTTGPSLANAASWYCSLVPVAGTDRQTPVRLAEFAVSDVVRSVGRTDPLDTLGFALYRAGSYEEALRRLEERFQLLSKPSPEGAAVMALSHFRLGHRAEAIRWLMRPSEPPSDLWNELQLRLLRQEAEAVILYDPIFPADPFAH